MQDAAKRDLGAPAGSKSAVRGALSPRDAGARGREAPCHTTHHRTMPRLKGFDYSKPFFYMVTLKRLPDLTPFSQIAEGEKPAQYLIENKVTHAFARVIRGFHTTCRGLAPITCFTVMPDHLHLILKLEEDPDTKPLGTYVHWLMRALARAYWENAPGQGPVHKTPAVGGMPPNLRALKSAVQGAPSPCTGEEDIDACAHVFQHDWHDWIVKRNGQLATFTQYIRENPERAWLRKNNAHYFGMVRKVSFLGRDWFAYGNAALLDLPVLVAVKGHRTTKPGSSEWCALVEGCARIGPGGAGVGTFMSPLEKECGNAIATAGGKWIVLCPEGFGERWHPPRQKERLCAEGRMLFLSLYPVLDRQPTKAELYARCHEMGDLAVAALPPP